MCKVIVFPGEFYHQRKCFRSKIEHKHSKVTCHEVVFMLYGVKNKT